MDMWRKSGVTACLIAVGFMVVSLGAWAVNFNVEQSKLSDSDTHYLNDLVALLGQAPDRRAELRAYIQSGDFPNNPPPASYTAWRTSFDQMYPTSTLREAHRLLTKALDLQRKYLEASANKVGEQSPTYAIDLLNSSRENFKRADDLIQAACSDEIPENLRSVQDAIYNASMSDSSVAWNVKASSTSAPPSSTQVTTSTVTR
jgi:hypothetical protein